MHCNIINHYFSIALETFPPEATIKLPVQKLEVKVCGVL